MIKRSNHPVDQLELMAYVDGELSRERAAAAATHLEGCSQCQALASKLRSVSQELAGWQVEMGNLKIANRITVALEDHDRAQKKKVRHDTRTGLAVVRRRRIWPWALAGTSVAAAIALFGMVFLREPAFHRLPENLLAEQDKVQVYPYDGASQGDKNLASGLVSPKPAPSPSVGTIAQSESYELADSVASTTNGYVRNQLLTGPAARAAADQAAKTSTLTVPSGPMIVRTAELTIIPSDFARSREELEGVLKRHNGYLGDLNVSSATGSARTLTATLRVPSDQLDSAIAEIKKIGRVLEESQKGEEVTQQYVDIQARLQNSRNSEKRLTELLSRAGKLSDVLAVEEQIESVREDIERMDAERKNLAKQVDFATLNMKITEDYKESVHVVPDSTATRFRNAAVEGYDMMVGGLLNVLMFLVSWGPTLLVWGAVLFFPARWLWKRRQRVLY